MNGAAGRLVRTVVAVTGISFGGLSANATAQEFPTKPVRIVIAFPPGGPTDIIGRHFAEKLQSLVNQTFVVDNRPGANGAIGADFVAKSAPDGYTLFLTTVGAVAVTPNMRKDTPYDPLRDFAPIAQLVTNTTLLVVHPSVPARTATELVALVRATPGKITIASTGVGSMPHLAHELLRASSKADMIHVPYRGAAPAITEVLGGQVQVFFGDAPALVGHIRSGKLRVLGAASTTRSPLLQDIPTLAEQNIPRVEAPNWYALFAPAKTPEPILARLNDLSRRALDAPDLRAKFAQLGADATPFTREQLAQLLRDDLAKWGRVIRDNNITE